MKVCGRSPATEGDIRRGRQIRRQFDDIDERMEGQEMVLRTSEVHIESNRLSIKPFSASDADATFPCITPSLTRFMSWEPPANRDDFDRVWRSWLPAIDDGSDFVFAIRQLDDGSFLGLAGLHHVRNESPELGIWIREDHHRKGFGREAVGLIAQWATRAIGAESFTYPVAEENHPSRRIAESLGGVIIERRVTPKYSSVIYRIPKQPVTAQA
jgi:RimJ/RimL family protein N-acetyltransferase